MSGSRPGLLTHLCIRASAGSGKTYQLSKRYLALVAAGAEVGSILATTFTRVAAGEIRDRIFLRLATAADDPAERAMLAKDLSRASLSRDEVLELLARLIRNLHRMQIRTLDSFFASVIRSFTVELGIPPGAAIVDEYATGALQEEAIAMMLEGDHADRFVELLRRLTQGTADRSVFREIETIVESLSTLSRETEDAAWDCILRAAELAPAELGEAVAGVETCAVPEGALATAHANDVEHARRRDWKSLVRSGLAAKVVVGEASFRRMEIPPAIIEAYRPLVGHARAVLVNRARDQTLATRELLKRFEACSRELKVRDRILTFDDLTFAVNEAEKRKSLDEIWFRIDGAIQHLLLDEFQDTNLRQWRAIRPIAGEIVSDLSRPRTFFCVGDVKQSIYGWRDACPELLEEIPDLLLGSSGAETIRTEALALTRRSAPVIIDAVNRTFELIRNSPALADHADAAALFGSGFEAHGTTRTTLGGYVELRTVPRAGLDEEQAHVRLRSAADLVRRLHRQAPQRSIAILTRTNGAVSRLLFELTRGIDPLSAAGRGGGPLTDAPAVNAVLDLLRLADHPDDTISAFNVAGGPLGALLEFEDPLDASARRGVARSVRRRLLESGYAKVIDDWTRRLAPDCDGRQHARLVQLGEIAAAHDPRATLRPSAFVRLVEALKVADAGPAPIQVMTIHQSKGLEFDIVVLPDLEDALTGKGHAPVVFERDGVTGPITRVCRWISSPERKLLPDLLPMFERFRQRTVRESLCLLYVAMTRAKQGLYMVIDPPPLDRKGAPRTKIATTPAGVLLSAFTDESPPEPDDVLFEKGDPRKLFGTDDAGAEATPEEPADVTPAPLAVTLAPPSGAMRPSASAPSASALHRLETPLREQLRLGGDEARDRGLAVHALFELIEWIEEWEADRDTLAECVRRVVPRRDARWGREVVDTFLTGLRRPAVRRWLARAGASPDDLRVWRERRFARRVPGGRGRVTTIQEGSIDRLVAHLGAGGAVERATVVDFKTDRIGESEVAAAAERHRPQLEAYRAAAARMLRLDDADVEMVVVFVEPGSAVELQGVARAG